MFEITDAEKLRDAYTLLAFIRDDVPATAAEQKSSLAAFMVSIKKEIRAYNNRPAPDSRIVEEHGIDGYIELVQLPDELDKVNEDDAAEYFRDRAQQCNKWIERYTWHFGENSPSVKEQKQYKDFYNSVVARLEA